MVGKKILIVDDEKDALTLLEIRLSSAGILLLRPITVKIYTLGKR